MLRRAEIQAVYSGGVRVGGRLLIVFAQPGAAIAARIGLTATRKVGGSVVRNRWRRLLRECFRRHRASLPAWDFVFNVKATASLPQRDELDEEFRTLVKRALRQFARDRRREAEGGFGAKSSGDGAPGAGEAK